MNQLLLALFVATPLVICILDEKPYNHRDEEWEGEEHVREGDLEEDMEQPSAPPSALDLCIIGLRERVQSGNLDKPLHRKLKVKMMFRFRRDNVPYGEQHYSWSEPEVYHPHTHCISQSVWVWSTMGRKFVKSVSMRSLREYQFYDDGRVIERDPYDNSVDYPSELPLGARDN